MNGICSGILARLDRKWLNNCRRTSRLCLLRSLILMKWYTMNSWHKVKHSITCRLNAVWSKQFEKERHSDLLKEFMVFASRQFFAKNNTVMCCLHIRQTWLSATFPYSKNKENFKESSFHKYSKSASLKELNATQRLCFSSALRIGKSAGVSILYLRGITSKEII